jgi:DNA-binding NtrC family response regulator
MTVLLIEDYAPFRELMARVLRRAGYDVLEAENGRHGWRLYSAHRPHVVVTDLLMPDQDGLQTLRAMLADNPLLKVLVISGSVSFDVDYLSLARQLGAAAALRKPFGMGELLDAVGGLSGAPVPA